MKIAFVILLLVHGLIHILGFLKSFRLAEIGGLTLSISKPAGMFWLLTTVLFLTAVCLILLRNPWWWAVALPAALLSQILILQTWSDAKFGTIANVFILFPVIVAIADVLPSSYQNRYRSEVQRRLHPDIAPSVLSNEDVRHLPAPVQKYLQYTGAVGRPRVLNFRAVSRGSMKRSMESGWMDITAEQYDFFDEPARLFYIESRVFGVPFAGLHAYTGQNATMEIKVASLVQVADAKGPKMNQGETVTLFNDMCLLAPATLVGRNIEWEGVDSLRVKARFTNQGNTISALLTFNENGELVNFISNDRFLSEDGKAYLSYPWSTPVREFRDYGGRKAAALAEASWRTPQGEFIYAKYDLAEIEYNCTEFR